MTGHANTVRLHNCIFGLFSQELIKYIYTGKMYLCKDNIHDMIDASSRLQVDTAIKLCATYLTSVISEGIIDTTHFLLHFTQCRW